MILGSFALWLIGLQMVSNFLQIFPLLFTLYQMTTVVLTTSSVWTLEKGIDIRALVNQQGALRPRAPFRGQPGMHVLNTFPRVPIPLCSGNTTNVTLIVMSTPTSCLLLLGWIFILTRDITSWLKTIPQLKCVPFAIWSPMQFGHCVSNISRLYPRMYHFPSQPTSLWYCHGRVVRDGK